MRSAQPPANNSPQTETTMLFTPAGAPASGAKVVVVPPGHGAEITDGQTFDDDPSYQRFVADSNGQVRLSPATQPFLILIIHPTGYAQLDHSPDAEVHLQPWGRIEGKFMIGAKPAVGQNVISWIAPNAEKSDQNSPLAVYSTEQKTDTSGRFIVTRVPAGRVAVAPHPSPESVERPMQKIEVQPAKTATVTIGGQGRPIVGRVLIPPSLAIRNDWTFHNCFVDPKIDPVSSPMPEELKYASLPEQANWWQAFEKTSAAKRYQDAVAHRWDVFHARTYEFTIQSDGRFRVEDIVPGDYQVTFDVYTNKLANNPRQRLARGQADFTVPPIPGGRADDPLPIASVQVDTSILQDGDLAPDFAVPALQGRQLKLSDFRGKYVVLDFWATWCGPCMAELEATKNLYQAFHNDPRFIMIGLSLDTQPADPIECIAKNEMSWNQAFLGDWDNPAVKSYGVDSLGIPSLWLISTDGKIIAHSGNADKFKSIVANALQQHDAHRP